MVEKQVLPTLTYESRLWKAGYRHLAGLDEAGRGSWAGPVVAAAVILPPDNPRLAGLLTGVRDSKRLSAVQRELLLGVIEQHALAWSVGVVPPSEIDARGIVPATCKAMSLALAALSLPADHLLIDHLSLPDQPLPQLSLTKGDARVLSIAAASIVAKVSRDRMMVDFDGQFPGYGFAQHKGYGTPMHRAALASLGPCAIHRMSFAPLRELAPDEGR
ncbi:MAG: ribonuclease HII [Anaerolineae bacterium]|jgi:ribonuclease HII